PHQHDFALYLTHARLRQLQLRSGTDLLLDTPAHRVDELAVLAQALLEDRRAAALALFPHVRLQGALRQVGMDPIERSERRIQTALRLLNFCGDAPAAPQRLIDLQCRGYRSVVALISESINRDSGKPRPARSAQLRACGDHFGTRRIGARMGGKNTIQELRELEIAEGSLRRRGLSREHGAHERNE